MNIALPVLLLVLGSLTLWLLVESKVRWYLKILCITVFCMFTIIFWSTIHSYLGWPAHEEDVPDKVLVHWVVVKEPNKQIDFNGAIYFMLESIKEEENSLLKFFGYRSDNPEPRLFGFPYSRELHEQIEEQMRGKLQRGQPVLGNLKKGKKGKPKLGNSEKAEGDGDGSESQKQEWQFHFLRPSDFLKKPER